MEIMRFVLIKRRNAFCNWVFEASSQNEFWPGLASKEFIAGTMRPASGWTGELGLEQAGTR